MKKYLSLSLALLLFSSALFAQCAPATAKDTLNINQVSALMLNGGDLWGDNANQNHGQYEVPKGSGIMSMYRGALWIGGIDAGGNLHGAMQMYRNGNDFWPGPLDTLNASIDFTNCALYDKIWKVNRDKVEAFKYYWAHGNVQNGTYTPDPSILSWPGNGNTSLGFSPHLAPYVDVNHNGIYDPLTGGDYPKMKGDQMLWWVMNDKGNLHTNTNGTPMGIEIHASAYAFTCPQIADSEKVINYTTLYHYEIINRSSMVYDSVYVANWQDGDLGCLNDDHVGCYPAGNYSYYYNEDSIDVTCWSELGYGWRPAISSTVILNGPLAKPNDGIDNNNNGTIDEPGEKNLMSHFFYWANPGNGPHQDPQLCNEYYHYLSGTWMNGSPLVYGGSGWAGSSGATTTPTAFCYPSFPYDTSGWHEIIPGNPYQDDRRDMTSCGPFTMLPGAVDTFDFAVVYTRDTTLPFMSQAIFDKNMHDNQRIQRWFANNSFPSCLPLNLAVNEVDEMANAFTIFPNPTNGKFNVSISQLADLKMNNIEIYNVMGECIHRQIATSSNFQIDLSEAKSGVYFLQLQTSGGVVTKKLVVSK